MRYIEKKSTARRRTRAVPSRYVRVFMYGRASILICRSPYRSFGIEVSRLTRTTGSLSFLPLPSSFFSLSPPCWRFYISSSSSSSLDGDELFAGPRGEDEARKPAAAFVASGNCSLRDISFEKKYATNLVSSYRSQTRRLFFTLAVLSFRDAMGNAFYSAAVLYIWGRR